MSHTLCKGSLYKYLTLLVCALALFISCAASAADQNRRTMRVGFFAFDGYHMMDERGKRSGYGYDLVNIANRYMNVKLAYVGYENTWQEMLEMLENGEVDILTNAQKSPEREEKFLFSSPTGVVYGILNVLDTNTKFIPGNIASYNGMSIGTFKGDQTLKEFEQWAGSRFSYRLVYFNNEKDLYDAFYEGKVDAILSNTFRPPSHERTLEKFYSNNIYAIFRKEDGELRDSFNYALMQMDANEGDWMHTLRYKYQHEKATRLIFTEHEKELISRYSRRDRKLIATGFPGHSPYSYVENGELKGIIPETFALLMQKAGIPYEVRVPKDIADYEDICFNNEADIIMDWRLDKNVYAEVFDYAPTASYLDARLMLLKRKDLNHPIKTVATVQRYGMPNPEDPLLTKVEVLRTPDIKQAIEAVADGRADATYVYFYTAMQYITDSKYNDLTYEIINGDPKFFFGIGVGNNVNYELSGILTKCIYSLSDDEKGQIIAKYTNYESKNPSLITYLKSHPLSLLLLISCLFAGLVIYLIMYLRLHERKKLLEAEQAYAVRQKQLAQKAQAASKSKTKFLFNMSHDIRTPMNAIIGFTTLAQDTDCLPKIKDYLNKINISSHHLLSLINDVLEMSRIESGKLTLNEVPCSVKQIFDNLATIMNGPVHAKNQTLNIELKNITNDAIYADTLRCGQVLVNLVSNSVKYTPEGGKITVSVEQLPDAPQGKATFEVHVIDNGIGMSPEFVERIFQPFERERNSTVSHIQGTGLGMSITKSIIDLAHGTIDVHSVLGEGTDIVIRLSQPIYEGQLSTQQEQHISSNASPSFTGKHILVVEDNELNREIAVTMLRQSGFTTEEANDGQQAVEKISQAPPAYFDLILMDIQMPNMDGYTATKLIRKLPDPALANIPIIAVSANAFDTDKQTSLEAGMNAHIAKPINMKEFFKAIQEIIDQQNQSL